MLFSLLKYKKGVTKEKKRIEFVQKIKGILRKGDNYCFIQNEGSLSC